MSVLAKSLTRLYRAEKVSREKLETLLEVGKITQTEAEAILNG